MFREFFKCAYLGVSNILISIVFLEVIKIMYGAMSCQRSHLLQQIKLQIGINLVFKAVTASLLKRGLLLLATITGSSTMLCTTRTIKFSY